MTSSSEQQGDLEFFWPAADQPGFYLLEHATRRPSSWNWTGKAWEYMYTTASTERLMELGYMGVRRKGLTGPVAALQPVRMPSSDADYPQWAKDIVEAIREVRDELQAAERRARYVSLERGKMASLTPEEIAAETEHFEEWKDAFLEMHDVYPHARVAWLAAVDYERSRHKQERSDDAEPVSAERLEAEPGWSRVMDGEEWFRHEKGWPDLVLNTPTGWWTPTMPFIPLASMGHLRRLCSALWEKPV